MYKHNRFLAGFTLMELMIAILLFSVVALTGITLEMAMRRMQTKPTAQTKLLGELIPVINRIRNDFENQIGGLYNNSLYIQESNQRVVIRVDYDNSGTVSAPDQWHAYRWPGGTYGSIYYSSDNFTSSNETIANGITYFNVVAPAAYNNTALTVTIRTRKDPTKTESLFDNPAVNLTTTFFSRMTSGR
ncbi:MAG: prepilin-type N-terminal cleavage/methylation domain-containing protein [Candidatus Omnitrophica bacterium]|nr:prepilin-type N-terminal cleavage/methylation domain-containing protein [Candidatus Omnitrophota bacterium]MDD5352626.1 prepilin-type N-terminal cleavage/methylation domain-containing protein [Candidatus Omnitrophota bacterium]MDD5550225.1 prepilin-type N-terminal cleavage/methylation domain-containing protein [Candidatus Omnitrophota bacterium]